MPLHGLPLQHNKITTSFTNLGLRRGTSGCRHRNLRKVSVILPSSQNNTTEYWVVHTQFLTVLLHHCMAGATHPPTLNHLNSLCTSVGSYNSAASCMAMHGKWEFCCPVAKLGMVKYFEKVFRIKCGVKFALAKL